MPEKENFALVFFVYQDGEENQYQYKVDALDEADAINKAPIELNAAEKHLGKKAHNPILVKVLSKLS